MQFIMLGIVLLSVPYAYGRVVYYNVVEELEQGHPIKAIINFIWTFAALIFSLAVTCWLLGSIPMLGHLLRGYLEIDNVRVILLGLGVVELSIMMIMVAGKFWIEH